MGVPAFYRWLSEKYPKIVVDMLEDRSVRVAGTEIPLDLTAGNPNGIEFDNLYIDMNGIIHPCSHPEDKPPPETEEDMYKNIMEYVDRLFSAVRPRRLLYLAIDGVAPRAKMNQQRSRRFRSAQEAEEAADLREEIRQSMKEMGMKVPPKSKPSWDSNIITPGTTFMHKLSVYLRFYVQDRVNRDKAWQNIKVILSDASEPGEGEHKIMDFVRRQRNQPGYDPNQHHILHGLDADLIMLGLATHERSFTILREQVLFGRKQREASERKAAALEQQRLALTGQEGKEKRGEHGEHDGDVLPHKPLQMLQLWVLREYLENEFRELQAPGRVPFGYDFERLVDDFVFLCFFVGNDFLPHLPSLDIRDGAIDYLFNVYKRVISSLGDYLTASGGVVNLKQVDVIMAEVGEIEDEVFRRRKVAETKDQARRGGGMSSSHGGRGADRHGGAPGAFPNGRDAGGRGWGGRGGGGRGGVTYPASTSERRQASKQTRQTMRDSDDAIKTGAVPVRSVKTDRLKDAKRKLEDGGERGTSWGGRRAGAEEGEGADAEHANKSAAAKLREKLGGKKAAKATTTEDGAQPPPLKVPRVKGGCKGKRGGRGDEDEAGLENGVGVFDVEDQEDEDGDETDNEDEEEEDEGGRDMTPEEVNLAKSFLKDKVKDQVQELLDEARNNVQDKVRLWEAGWKDRYYTDKCKVEDIEGGGGRERLFQTYVEGLCWVMLYYYQGCPSWTWYFPFHYAPFASDLINCDRFEMKFEESRPFRPIEQLMGVLPAASCKALPKPCRQLMTDPDSPIIDFYPKIVPCDPNGKPMPWLWVVLLPFIDEKRLLSNLQPLYKKFTPEEVERNSFGPSYLFVNVRTPVGKSMEAFLSGRGAEVEGLSLEGQQGMGADQMVLHSEAWGGFGGKVALPRAGVSTPVGATLVAPQQPQGAFEDLENNQVAMTVYSMPPKGAHVCRMLPGVQMLARTLTAQDLASRRPPRLNRNMSIAEMGSSKYNKAQAQGGYRSGVHGGGSSGPGHRMIRHQLGASSGGYHGQQYSHSQGGHSSYGAMGYQTPGYVPGGSGSGGYATKGYEDRHHMHQPTGNRRWGSQEPTPKRPGRGRSNQHQHRHQQHEAYRQAPPPQQQAFYSHAASQPVAQQSSVAYGLPQPVYYQQPLQAAPTQLSGFYGTVQQQQVLAQAPQASHSFQHPGYAPQPTLPSQAPAGPGGFPTMDSLRSKLANALLQSKVPGTASTVPSGAAQGSYYAQTPQGTPSPQQYFATAPAPAAPQPQTAAAPVYPYQHIRFDSNGNPTWGGQPWSSTGGAPPR
ncbi:unnamed protein product [Ascophyllum nodosum]